MTTTNALFRAFTLLSFFFLTCSSEDTNPSTITIPLTPTTFVKTPYSDPYLDLANRAHRSKSIPSIKEPLFPHSYAGHSITLSFGSPPQSLPFLLDTGSHVVWFPCTTKFVCINCSFSNVDPKKIPFFDPKLSSSSKILGCKNPKCLDPSTLTVPDVCSSCNRKSKNCSLNCPDYKLQYGKGATAGHYLLEKLKFPEKTVKDFLVGCSTTSINDNVPHGIAGFGRAPTSLPMQMGVKKFAYCLNSHDFDETLRSGKLIMDYRGGNTKGLSYTSLLNNPATSPFYYYISLKDIIIGKKPLRIPNKHLAPGPDGKGGAIVDNGFGYGYMAEPVYELVVTELNRHMTKYRRAVDFETKVGFTPCYNYSDHKSIRIPEFAFEFASGAKMVLPSDNYFAVDPHLRVACFIIPTRENSGLEVDLDTSIVIGNAQQINFYVEYDLENGRFGFRKKTCW